MHFTLDIFQTITNVHVFENNEVVTSHFSAHLQYKMAVIVTFLDFSISVQSYFRFE